MKTVLGMFDQKDEAIPRVFATPRPGLRRSRHGHPDQRQSRRHTQAGEDAYLGPRAGCWTSIWQVFVTAAQS